MVSFTAGMVFFHLPLLILSIVTNMATSVVFIDWKYPPQFKLSISSLLFKFSTMASYRLWILKEREVKFFFAGEGFYVDRVF